jgi:cytochrome P450
MASHTGGAVAQSPAEAPRVRKEIPMTRVQEHQRLRGVGLQDADAWDDPYPYLADIRSQGQLLWSDDWQMWLSAHHGTSDTILRNPHIERRYEARCPESQWGSFNRLNARAALDMSGSEHTRVRKALTTVMRPTRSTDFSALVASEVDRLLDLLSASGTQNVDIVTGLIEPLPVNIICAALNLEEGIGDRLRNSSIRMVAAFEKGQTPAEAADSQLAARELEECFLGIASTSRSSSAGRHLDSLLEQVPGSLSLDEAVANAILLFNGGTGALINALGTGLVTLLQQQELASLSTPDAITLAVEEMLRHDAPLQLFERTADEEISFGGVTIAPGDRVGLLLGGANRDPEVFESPDRFDPARHPNPHLTFSAGQHFCLGAPLARLEMQHALRALVDRFPRMHLAAPPLREPGFVVRGYSTILVNLE